MIHYKKLLNNRKLTIAGIVLVVAVVGTAVFFGASTRAHSSNPAADKAFTSYLVFQASTDHLEQTSITDDPDNSYTSKVVLDIPSDRLVVEGDLVCSDDIGNQKASVNPSIQATNAQLLFNIHHITGQVTFSKARVVNLSDLYAPELNKWYYASNFTGLSEFSSSQKLFMAKYLTVGQTTDAHKLATDLIASKAVTNKLVSQNGNTYTYSMTIHRQQYKQVLARAFPNTTAPVLNDGIDTLFDNKDSINDTVTIAANGELLKENTIEHNICQELSGRFIGTNPDTAPKDAKTETVSQQRGKVQITPITDYQLESEMNARQTIYSLHTGNRL